MDDQGNHRDDESRASDVDRRARRKLLKIAVYTPPAVIGTLLLSRDALAAPPTNCQPNMPCPPAICKPQPCGPAPCPPYPWGCSPDPFGGVSATPSPAHRAPPGSVQEPARRLRTIDRERLDPTIDPPELPDPVRDLPELDLPSHDPSGRRRR